MLVRRNSAGELSLVLDSSTLRQLIDSTAKKDADAAEEVIDYALDLDLDHPLIKRHIDEAVENEEDIVALDFDASISSELATRFKSISLHSHRIRSVLPPETLKLFDNVESLKLRGVAEVEMQDWPDWVFYLRGLKEIVDGDVAIDVGGLEKVSDGDTVVDLGGCNEEGNSIPTVDLRSDSVFYRFRLSQFKLLCMMLYKKGILDLSARKENPFTRGKPVKELVLW